MLRSREILRFWVLGKPYSSSLSLLLGTISASLFYLFGTAMEIFEDNCHTFPDGFSFLSWECQILKHFLQNAVLVSNTSWTLPRTLWFVSIFLSFLKFLLNFCYHITSVACVLFACGILTPLIRMGPAPLPPLDGEALTTEPLGKPHQYLSERGWYRKNGIIPFSDQRKERGKYDLPNPK